MRSLTSRLVLVALLSAVIPPARAAGPEDRKAAFRKAQTHIHLGAKLFRTEEYRAALVAFEEAIKLFPSARIQYLIGRCHQQLGEVRRAIAAYEKLVRQDPGSPEAEKALVALAELRVRLPGELVVTCAVKGASVRLGDGEALPCPVREEVPPGKYTVYATAPGRRGFSTRVEVRPGERTRVTARLTSEGAPPEIGESPATAVGGPEQTARASALDYALWGGAGTLAGAAVVAAVALLAVQPGRTRVPDTVLGSYPVFQ